MADFTKMIIDNTTYNVKDDTARNKINSLIDYSTNEVVIGTWTNGKPLYRKVFNTTLPNSSPNTVVTINNINILVKLDGYVTNGVQQIPLNYNYGVSEFTSLYLEASNIIFHSNYNGYYGKSCVIICEYTKTTD